ncbi:MAG TPA: aminotransferase class I/II-fold pyridoxal phosphate-dependent enzyme [Hyphomicrobiaceae bacterium]|nr:aminotransferase class I/II-fold pyridoxal phosphate-dependent enzyme [Hyphomicrobiaceae bacterium]
MSSELSQETIAAQAGGSIEPETGAIIPPIHISTTFERDADNQNRRGYSYGRPDNATVRQVEAILTRLEGGATSLLFASGMSAATALFLTLDKPAHVVAPAVMYWGMRKWLLTEAPAFGIETSLVDASDLDAIAGAIRPGLTRLVWLETPANPLWTISDIAGAGKLAHAAGAVLAVDSTVATPVLCNPLALGADVVMHSATKYLNGHTDVVAGTLTFAGNGPLAARASTLRSAFGTILAPFAAAQLMRGLRTLFVRVRHQCRAAQAIAEHFDAHAKIERVLYPGLSRAPGHELAKRQMKGGFGGMLSIRVRGGEAAAIATAAKVKVWKRATSLGGVESLIEHRASVEGPATPCPPDLLRLSVGLEAPADLIADLERALAAAV